jgi:hypothetical protein
MEIFELLGSSVVVHSIRLQVSAKYFGCRECILDVMLVIVNIAFGNCCVTIFFSRVLTCVS